MSAPGALAAAGEPPRDARRALLLAALAFVAYAAGATFGVPASKGAVGATRILAGDVPYRDFWSVYAPGHFYLVAGLFAALGREWWVAGLGGSLLQGLAAALFFLLARRLGLRPRVALAAGLVHAAMGWHPTTQVTSYPPAWCMLLGALVLWFGPGSEDALGRGRGPWRSALAGLLAGLLVGSAAWFKHDVAAYTGLALVLAALFDAPQGSRRRILPLVAGGTAGLASLVVWLAVVAGPDAWEDLVRYPTGTFRAVRGEPFPALADLAEVGRALGEEPANLRRWRAAGTSLSDWLRCHVPELFFFAGVWVVFLRPTRRERGRPDRARSAALFLLSWLPFFWMAAHVQRNTHLYSMGAVCLLLWGLADAALGDDPPPWRRRALRAAGALLLASWLLAPLLALARLAVELPGSRPLGLPGTAFVRVTAADHAVYVPLVERLRAVAPPDEAIHVGLLRHDATVVSNQSFYFLADRPPATRYNELHPGVSDRRSVQEEMIADLEARGVRVLLLWDFGWSDERLEAIRARNQRAVADAGSTLLDEWIAAHFERSERYGEYELWLRRPPESVPQEGGGG